MAPIAIGFKLVENLFHLRNDDLVARGHRVPRKKWSDQSYRLSPAINSLRDLPLELDAVGIFHPLKAQLTLSNH
jgi:hypothetical protein